MHGMCHEAWLASENAPPALPHTASEMHSPVSVVSEWLGAAALPAVGREGKRVGYILVH